jgi:hypothetical protein
LGSTWEAWATGLLPVLLVTTSAVARRELPLPSRHLALHEHRIWDLALGSTHHHLRLLMRESLLPTHHLVWRTWGGWHTGVWLLWLCWCWLPWLLWLLLVCVHILMINNLDAAEILVFDYYND